jgi:hypothetical protein
VVELLQPLALRNLCLARVERCLGLRRLFLQWPRAGLDEAALFEGSKFLPFRFEFRGKPVGMRA